MKSKLRLSPSEVDHVRFYRVASNRRDAERMTTPAIIRKYKAFLALYEYIKAANGEWIDKHAAARAMGMSSRQARRWIRLYREMAHPHIEAEIGAPGYDNGISRLRWKP